MDFTCFSHSSMSVTRGLPGLTMAPPTTSTKIHSTPQPSILQWSSPRPRATFSGSQSTMTKLTSPLEKGAHLGVLPWFAWGVWGVVRWGVGGPKGAGMYFRISSSSGVNFSMDIFASSSV